MGKRESHRRWGKARLFVVAAIAFSTVSIATAQPITRIADIHGPRRRVYEGTPVTIEGVVTQYATGPWGFSVQDATEGIYVDTGSRQGLTDVRVGECAMVTGVVESGEFAPTVRASRIVKKGPCAMPAPHPVTETNLSGGSLDNLFVEVRGTVRAMAAGHVSDTHPAAFLMLDMQDRSSDSVEVVLTNPGEDPIRYVDAVVAARGVVSVIYNEKRQALGLKVLVDSPRDVMVLRAPVAGPFAIEPTPIADLLRWGVRRDWSHRVRVSGTLTLARSGEYVVLQDGQSAIRVDSESRENLKPGTRMEATGFVSASGYSASLRNGVIRAVGTGEEITPLRRWPKQLLSGLEDDLLVTTSATVLETGRVERRGILTLEDDGIQFEAEAPTSAASALQRIQPGARVEVTGVCQITADAMRRPKSLEVLIRNASDIRILSAGPAITMSRIAWSCAAAGAAALLCVLWALTLRRRVREQTEWIQESLDREHRTARLMAQRSAILERMGRDEALDSILREVVTLAETHIPGCGVGIRVCVEGETRDIGGYVEGRRAAASITASSNLGRTRVTLTLENPPASEQGNEALQVCRECLVLAVEHRDLHDRLLEQSFSDPLTNLPNRRLLEEQFRMTLDEAGRDGEAMAVFALDVDAFKEVNDTFGHLAGDAVLQELSRRFSAAMRRSDVLARVGGDEFLALLPRIGDRAHAMEIADRLLEAAAADIEVKGVRLNVSVSIGAAYYPDDGYDPETLRSAADMRMYAHKLRSARRARATASEDAADVPVVA